MTCTDDARVASLNDTHHHRPQAWETSGGKWGTLTSHKHVSARIPKLKILEPQVGRQWAACDIYMAELHNINK